MFPFCTMRTMNEFFFVFLLLSFDVSTGVWKHIKWNSSATANMENNVSTQCYCNKRRPSSKCTLQKKKQTTAHERSAALWCTVGRCVCVCVCVRRGCLPFFALILFCRFKCNVGNRCHSSVQSNNVFEIFFAAFFPLHSLDARRLFVYFFYRFCNR